jgi:hypothetical protein
VCPFQLRTSLAAPFVADDAVPQPVSAANANRQSAEAKQPVNLDGISRVTV